MLAVAVLKLLTAFAWARVITAHLCEIKGLWGKRPAFLTLAPFCERIDARESEVPHYELLDRDLSCDLVNHCLQVPQLGSERLSHMRTIRGEWITWNGRRRGQLARH